MSGDLIAKIEAWRSDLLALDFVEYSGPDPAFIENTFKELGLMFCGQVHGQNIKLYRKGSLNLILNFEPQTHAMEFVKEHGPGITGLGFLVKDSTNAFVRATNLGLREYEGNDHQKGGKPFPAVWGEAGSLMYFRAEADRENFYKLTFDMADENCHSAEPGFDAPSQARWDEFHRSLYGGAELLNLLQGQNLVSFVQAILTAGSEHDKVEG